MKSDSNRWLSLLTLTLTLTTPATAQETNSNSEADWNFILLTLDGVRFQEFFKGVRFNQKTELRGSLFPKFWSELAKDFSIFGGPSWCRRMKITDPFAISLPAYQAIFAGRSQGKKCKNNSCPQVDEETFPERLLREGVLKKQEIFITSSWPGLGRAVESKVGTLYLNSDQDSMVDPTDPTREVSTLTLLNDLQVTDRSPWGARYDRYTGEYGLWLLKNKRPRFLSISLNDSDEYGHAEDYDAYAKSLRGYDDYIKNLVTTVQSMGRYGERTAILITTDHGRGRWFLWGHHSKEYSSAKRVWNAVRHPSLEHPLLDFSDPRNRRKTTHADIRATIEAYFGLKTLTGRGYGRSLFLRAISKKSKSQH